MSVAGAALVIPPLTKVRSFTLGLVSQCASWRSPEGQFGEVRRDDGGVDVTDPERRGVETRGSQNEFVAVLMLVATRVESGESELGEVGVGSASQTLARVIVTLRVGSSEDGGGKEG